MQVYSQKSTRTTLPRSAVGGEWRRVHPALRLKRGQCARCAGEARADNDAGDNRNGRLILSRKALQKLSYAADQSLRPFGSVVASDQAVSVDRPFDQLSSEPASIFRHHLTAMRLDRDFAGSELAGDCLSAAPMPRVPITWRSRGVNEAYRANSCRRSASSCRAMRLCSRARCNASTRSRSTNGFVRTSRAPACMARTVMRMPPRP